MKKIVLVSLMAIMSFSFLAQNKTNKWAVGLNFGTKEYLGDLGSEFLTYINNHGAFGVTLGRYLNPSFDLMGDFSHGMIDFSGDKGSFETFLYDYNLTAKYKLNNGYFFKENSIIQPYIFTGVGLLYSEADHYSNTRGNSLDFGIPAGLGINLKINNSWAVQLRSLVKYTLSDDIDNNNDSPYNTQYNDIHTYHSVGVIYSFGKADADKDGVVDKEDMCPKIKGSIAAKGCPDADEDGVRDEEDQCPNVKGTVNGCPDADNDGVANKDDGCPGVAGTIGGCPDLDNDSIADKNDPCPGVFGTANGCPDADNDGVADKVDKCPTLAGGANGCPDSDGDGVNDGEDACPNEAGILKGCPDSDNDGIADKVDLCPTEAGDKAHNGCPKVNKKEKDVMLRAMQGLNFKSGSSVILGSSYAILDDVVTVMKNNKEIDIRIEGHTDNSGRASTNLRLSKKRAEAAKSYLIKRGIDASRLSAKGFGGSNPVDSNSTDEGRRNNRRVEFIVNE